MEAKTENGGSFLFERDEHVRPGTTPEILAGLKTVFKEDGVIHAGNSSGIVDGSAAVLWASKKACKKYDLPVIIPDYISEDDICEKIKYDKHHLKGMPTMALVEKIGFVWNDKDVYGLPIDYSILRKAIRINKSKKEQYGG